jgi:hypothetical protein
MWNTKILRAALKGGVICGLVLATAPLARAACYPPDQALPAKTVAEFTADPARLLQKFPNGGADMIATVRDLAASNPTTLGLFKTLLVSANKEQASAIGTGLGQAALVCIKDDQPYATEIQQMVVDSANNDAVVALNAVLGDRPITAALAAGGGGGGGGPTNSLLGGSTGSTPSTPFGPFSQRNVVTNFFTSSFRGGGTTTTTTTPTLSSSPH